MIAQMKLATSEYKLSAAQAKAMGSAVDELRAKETQLTANIKTQNNIIDAYQAKLEDQKAALQQLQNEESRLRTEKERLTKAYKQSVEATGEDSEESQKLAKQLQETEEAHAKAEKAIERQNTAIRQNNTKLYENKAKLNDMNQSLEATQRELKETEHDTESFSSEIKKAGKNLDEAGEKGVSFGDLIKANVISDVIINGVEKLADGIKSITGSIVNTGMEFEAQMDRVGAIAGAKGTKLEKLQQQAIDLGASTAFSASEAALGMENLASAGFEVDQIMDAMPGMLDLAASSGEDLATSADIAASILNGFGKEASEAGHVADVLAKNAADTNAAVYDTGEAMKYIAPVAYTAGLQMEEITACIGIMADAGIQGSQAGTSLRGALSRLAKPTDSMLSVMDRLGISFYDSEGKMKSMTEMIEMLQTSMKGLTDEEKQKAIVTLFGQNAESGMLALISAGSEELKEKTAALQECDGAAKDMADTMLDNLKGSVDGFTGALETMGIQIYNSMGGPLTNLADWGTEIVNQLTQGFTAGGAEGLVNTGITMVAQLMNGMTSQMPSLTAQAGEMVSGLLSGIRTQLPWLLSSGTDVVASFISGIGAQLPVLIPQGLQMVLSLAESVISNAPKLVDAGIDLIGGLVQGVINAAPTLISQVPVLINQFWSTFDGSLGKILSSGAKLVVQLGKGLISNLPLIKQNAGEIIKAIFNTIMHINFLSAGKNLMTNLKTGISSMKTKLGAAAKDVGNKALQTVKNINWVNLGKTVITFVKNGISGAGSLLKSGIKAVGTQGLNAFRSINWVSLGKTVITFIKNGITGAVKTLGSALKSAGTSAIKSFKSIDFKSAGKAIVDGIKSGLKTAAYGLASTAADMARSAVTSVKRALGIASPSRVFKEQVGLMMGAGIQVGFKDSMEDARESMASNLQTLTSDITANVNPIMQVKKSAQITQNEINQTRKITTNDISSRTDENIVIQQTNVTYLDGEEISRKTTDKVVRKISRDERNRKIYKGEPVMA